jgi:hypothetical protein
MQVLCHLTACPVVIHFILPKHCMMRCFLASKKSQRSSDDPEGCLRTPRTRRLLKLTVFFSYDLMNTGTQSGVLGSLCAHHAQFTTPFLMAALTEVVCFDDLPLTETCKKSLRTWTD